MNIAHEHKICLLCRIRAEVLSVAEIERVFSAAKYVLSENRRSVTPQLFEDIMFLNFNIRFWDAPLVEETIRETRKERASGRYMAHKVRDDEKLTVKKRSTSDFSMGQT